eukprot:gnl/TRDRNA2_/TRDRNA2_152394_c1_seq2.p1 gnl/TRDRNA2_/TRDRNA2_152394_c1~~gnl/TRDRNA2_/TRDRNA2_152394_c1_seq2.p1  ORF type:complete len:783 (+),score=164.24 gnl/TRDRNA2_/TRDRNA2_152394_c1_seq2:233-2350(+)
MALMLQHDPYNDPFFEWSKQGTWNNRNIRMAESILKPLAYYRRNEDNTEYTLMYVNILTGITHQVRITCQSLGHPLVSDDRYLPKEQATSDLKWCPRNFLTEVRSDFYDLGGPHADEKRRKYTRISIENPLPQLFQNVLEKKLTLVEQLDLTADLCLGPQYWAIGDEQLMAAYPKENDFRKKVIRWGMRRGIHLDALDKLLLLPKDQIEGILNRYKAPDDLTDNTWVCPYCMTFNTPQNTTDSKCYFRGLGIRSQCPGTRVAEDPKMKLPKGWKNWCADPTMHFNMIINSHWLQARRVVLKSARPAWERAPLERDGSACTADVLLFLEPALVINAQAGGFGIPEDELHEVKGLEKLKLPLGAPPEDCNVQRTRLPGHGTFSRWMYCLKGKFRIKYTQDFKVGMKRLDKPVSVPGDVLPEKMKYNLEEEQQRAKMKEEQEIENQFKADMALAEGKTVDEVDVDVDVEAPPAKKRRIWQKVESQSNPGNFYYFDKESGESSMEKPADFVEPKVIWEKRESKSNPGNFYYFNKDTGENKIERPKGVEILHDDLKVEKKQVLGKWERKESTSRPGSFYYFNDSTGNNEILPPTVEPPWELHESKSKKGHFYYYNKETNENTVHPPPSAKPAKEVPATGGDFDRPECWQIKMSGTHRTQYYINSKTGETRWEEPACLRDWDRMESKSNPGKFYLFNKQTQECRWLEDVGM